MPDPTLEIGIGGLEATALRIATGLFVLEAGRVVLRGVVPRLRVAAGRPHLAGLEAASAELSDVRIHGPLVATQHPAGAWNFAPLAVADGTIRARIVDAHLLFDADVTVPIRYGQVDFDDATVEHVGPDSRMGVSRLGLYVDAPNGRSYLYQFAATPVAGVEYERRDALLGPWVSDRGKLQLQAFVEGLVRQAVAERGPGFTEQTRLLLDRTALSGDLQLGDGRLAAPGLQAELAGRAGGRNAIRVHSDAVGRGVAADVPGLLLRNLVLAAFGAEATAAELTGSLQLRLFIQDGQLRFAIELASATLSGLRLELPA